jgi:starvation-inducible DNA-binding protein
MHTANKKVTDSLSHLLADTYTLYLKTQNFHWHVTGPNFHSFHLMFEEQYNKLALANDEIAERIRTLGAAAPATFKEFLQLTAIKEEVGKFSANDMVKKLLHDHEIVIKNAKELVTISQEMKDEETADLGIKRVEEHEKTAWMLRSSME